MSHEKDTSDADADRQPIRRTWDEFEHPSTAVIEAVAAATDREPAALPPLHGYVDADALDALLGDERRRKEPSETDASVRVSFVYDGVEVAASGDGHIEVWPDDRQHARGREGPQTAAELETRLRALFRAAQRNGVAVTGGWSMHNGPNQPDWDVHVTRVERPEDEDASGHS